MNTLGRFISVLTGGLGPIEYLTSTSKRGWKSESIPLRSTFWSRSLWGQVVPVSHLPLEGGRLITQSQEYNQD